VKGVVRDAAGNPMIGVTVTIKGTLVGVSTGVDGGYAIPADGNATLLFSYIGYRPHEEVVGRRTQIDVTMQEDELVMDEVVVVGYGTLKKRNIVGAVENLSGDAVENRPNANITRSLQGQIPGLNIVQVDGKADHAGEVTIRGVNNTFKARVSGGEKTNKLGQGGGALVLIDGAEGDMGSVNPDDIASISVLKDASSAAVYGARGAFGVILITTKDPEKGKVRVSYNGSVSLHRRTVIWEDNVVTDPVQWVDAFRESYLNSSPTATVPSLFNNYMPYSNAWLTARNVVTDPFAAALDADGVGGRIVHRLVDLLEPVGLAVVVVDAVGVDVVVVHRRIGTAALEFLEPGVRIGHVVIEERRYGRRRRGVEIQLLHFGPLLQPGRHLQGGRGDLQEV